MSTKTKFEEIKRFESDLEQCTKCGFCTFFCPVYQEERTESSVARGKNMLIRALLAGDLSYTKEFADKKMEAIESTGADIVATSCPGCQIQLLDGAIRNKMPLKVMHIMELLE